MASPTTDFYGVASGQPVVGGRNRLWASGSETGSYDSVTDTWAPGRDSNGYINAVSWALVPTGRWVKVSGTRMDVLDSVVKATVTDWTDYGNGGWDGVLKAWNGMAVDPSSPRAFFFGGGHFDSSNNGLYRFDFLKMAWAVQIMPTSPSLIDASYKMATPTGGFSAHMPAYDYEVANPNQNLVFRDCFYPLAPNAPTSRHTYGSLVYNPSRNELYMGNRRMWIAHLSTGTWSVRMPFGNNVNGYFGNGLSGYTGENMHGWLDEATGQYIVQSTQAGNESAAWQYDPATEAFSWRSGLIGAYESSWIASCKVGRVIYSFYPKDASHSGNWITQDLDTQTWSGPNMVDNAALNDTDNSTAGYDGGSLTYVPEAGKFMLAWRSASVTAAAGGNTRIGLYWIDPDTRTMTSMAIVGNWYSAANPVVETKLQYIPQIKSVVHIDSATDDIRIMRFA